uniref:Tumor protein p53-inducible protein 11 n=1 Tax=Ciona savignyi TaxID=51511 RepID=H2Y546_CIOSA
MANVLHSIQSRLKSRKVLGVGESIDGKIPRSKISQLLGCNHMEPWSLLTEDYPIGLRMFQRLMCLAFILFGSVNLYFPEKFYGNFVCSASSEEFVPSLRHLTVEIRASYADMTSSRQEELEKQLEALEKATCFPHSLRECMEVHYCRWVWCFSLP